MIDFYPFIIIGIAVFLNESRFKIYFYTFSIPLIGLNILQCYQIEKSIYKGGETNSSEYWNHFLEWKTIAPTVKIDEKWQLLQSKSDKIVQQTNSTLPFTRAIDSDTLDNIEKIIVDLLIGGEHGDPSTCLVTSNASGSYYKSYNFGDLFYETPRKMSFEFDVPKDSNQVYKTYIWNSNSTFESKIEEISVKYFRVE
jgi:hypothetical protein